MPEERGVLALTNLLTYLRDHGTKHDQGKVKEKSECVKILR